MQSPTRRVISGLVDCEFEFDRDDNNDNYSINISKYYANQCYSSNSINSNKYYSNNSIDCNIFAALEHAALVSTLWAWAKKGFKLAIVAIVGVGVLPIIIGLTFEHIVLPIR